MTCLIRAARSTTTDAKLRFDYIFFSYTNRQNIKHRKQLAVLQEIDNEVGFQDKVKVKDIDTTPRELATAIAILKLLRRGEIAHALFFYNSREDADDMGKLLHTLSQKKDTNLCVNYVDCEDKGKKREEKFDTYRMSEMGVIVSVNTIAEGVNLNETDAAVLVDMTASAIRITQIAGRPLRRHVYKLRDKVRVEKKKKLYVHCSARRVST